MNLFSDKKINTGRQVELDIAKALSIIFMVFVHVLIVAKMSDSAANTSMYQIVVGSILGCPCAAPIFMFCMGVGVVYSRNSRPRVMIKRGFMLILLGILVNFFIYLTIPIIEGITLNQWDILFDRLLFLFYVDILAFAGLSFIVLGILKKFNISNKQLLIIGICLSILGSLLRFTDFNNNILNLIFGYFIGTAEVYSKSFGTGVSYTSFPFFNWFIFPIIGYIWGNYFIRLKDKSKFFRLWPVFIIIALIYFICSLFIPNGFLNYENNYYFMTTADVIFCLIYIHGNIGLCWSLSKILPDKIIGGFSFLSKNITNIYVLQWLFIRLTLFSMILVGIKFNDMILILTSVFILILSSLCVVIYGKLKNGTVNRC